MQQYSVCSANVYIMARETLPEIHLTELLQDMPPNRGVMLSSDSIKDDSINTRMLAVSDIVVWCPHEACNRAMLFEPLAISDLRIYTSRPARNSLVFRCKHCEQSSKTISIVVDPLPGTLTRWAATKLGELPPFGAPIPSRVLTLMGADQKWFVKGLRSEEQGFGIGAFAYYRRVVERQWNRLLNEIIRVAERTDPQGVALQSLRAAAAERQFAKSIDMVRQAIPPVLLIDSHNPIALLHDALSEGLHAQDDEVCLDLAVSIREILYALSRKMHEALQNEVKLNDALTKLHQRKSAGVANRPPKP